MAGDPMEPAPSVTYSASSKLPSASRTPRTLAPSTTSRSTMQLARMVKFLRARARPMCESSVETRVSPVRFMAGCRPLNFSGRCGPQPWEFRRRRNPRKTPVELGSAQRRCSAQSEWTTSTMMRSEAIRVCLQPLEVGRDICEAPFRIALLCPSIEIRRPTPQCCHSIDGGCPTDHLAAQIGYGAAFDRSGLIAPIMRGSGQIFRVQADRAASSVRFRSLDRPPIRERSRPVTPTAAPRRWLPLNPHQQQYDCAYPPLGKPILALRKLVQYP